MTSEETDIEGGEPSDGMIKQIHVLSKGVGELIEGISEVIPPKMDKDQLTEIIKNTFEEGHHFRPEIALTIAKLLAESIVEKKDTAAEG